MKKLVVILVLTLLRGQCTAADNTNSPRPLTLKQAQELAIKQHPRISVANLIALATLQQAREVRSALLPNVFASATAVDTADPNNTRIGAGAINAPLIYQREADGATITQLITDFGRSWELTKSAKLRTRSEEMNLEATREQIRLEVNNAYFSSLASQSVLQVAQETVRTRQLILQQTQALATNKLKSDLDVRFASVDFDQASIMVAKAGADLKASFAVLSEVLGEPRPQEYRLAEVEMPPYKTNAYPALLLEALQQRPELAQLRYSRDAAAELARAERKLDYPSLNALGTAGIIPTGNSHLSFDYAAAGVNLNIPIYTGGNNAARRREAELRAKAADEALREEEDTIARDVQTTSLNLDYAYQRVGLTGQLLQNANEALELAQARFKLGSSSIIELSQAELNQTSAQIAEATARYDYQTQHSALDFQLGRLR